jgi:DNA polymerase-4
MVKQEVFCKEISFTAKYKDFTRWDCSIKFTYPLQDAMEMRSYILDKIQAFENQHKTTILNNKLQHFGVAICRFIRAEHVSYTLFDNKMRQDKLRKVMYNIKDKYGRDIVRKASEDISPHEMKDAIGFGSVKDLEGNNYLLEE